jgi:uncharacterized OB-fold protein
MLPRLDIPTRRKHSDMRTLKPDLYTTPESPKSVPELRGGRCRCGYVFFPMQSYGCEKCGLTGEAVMPTLLRTEGSLTASARVLMHAAKDRTPPFVVVAVRLDAGPVVRSLLDRDRAEQLPIGTRMQGLLTEVGRADDGEVIVDLRFTPVPSA